MPAPRKYPPELRERAIRLVQEARVQDAELSLNQVAIDSGERPGTTTTDARKIHELEAEVRELKRGTRSCWRHRVSSRGSSTRDCRGDRVHR